MKELFDELSFSVSKKTALKYSTSFSLGIKSLGADIRPAIYAIYGFVRLADEVVDSFHGFDKEGLLVRLRGEVRNAIDEKISLNPILNSFQQAVNQYDIEWELIDTFLKSMEMDLYRTHYNAEMYNEYILGSAEVVGLMCLKVFVYGNEQEYGRLKPYAMKLGSAFQKVNFLRDIKDDFEILGRTYFPGVDLRNFDSGVKIGIELEIENEFREALAGIKMLPVNAKFGVFLAYTYYISLFRKIQNTPASAIAKQRIRINNGQKFSLMLSSYFQCKLAMV
jgi:phytoene synthase